MPHFQPRWIALLGRRDEPVDGVEDYCNFLSRGLEEQGVRLELVRMRWAEIGWIRALLELRRESVEWKGKWILLQYTALSWSRRGFPYGAIVAGALAASKGARLAIVFHEPHRQVQSSPRKIDRIRGVAQDYVIRKLYRQVDKAVFTVPIETVGWLPKCDGKAVFIPIGANIPQRLEKRSALTDERRRKTVLVFGVTGAPAMEREVEEISGVMKKTSNTIGSLRLVVIGRGALEARELLVKALGDCEVELKVRGVLPAEEISAELEHADALLFVRGAISPRRGSALAGIACGVPVVGYKNGTISEPLANAGIEGSPWGDQNGLAQGLIRILSDGSYWEELHERNVALQRKTLSWARIAEQFRTVLAE